MIRIEGGRGIGKTSRLIFVAYNEGQTIVTPNVRFAKNVEDMAIKYFGRNHNIKIITAHEFFSPYFRPEKNEKFLIDDLDYILEDRHVVGYSMTDDKGERK